MKCDKCAFESENQSLFKTEREPFSKARTLCPPCQNAKETAVHKTVLWIAIILGLIGLALAPLLPRSSEPTPFVILLTVVVECIVFTFLHELGHVFFGKLAGFRIFAIELGIGQVALEFKRFAVRWRIRKLPVGARVFGFPADIRGFRLRRTFFILGGPAVNALLLLLAWKYREFDTRPNQTILSSLEPMRCALFLNALFLAINLLPFRAGGPEGRIPSDGLAIWLTWKLPRQALSEVKSIYYLFEAEESRREHKIENAIAWLEKGLLELPDNTALVFTRATYLIHQNKLQDARQALLGLRATLADNKALFPLLLNNIAYTDALIGTPELLGEADEFSQQALKNAPWHVYFKGTRGWVLVQLGRFDEGVALLKEALREHSDSDAKAKIACFLGIAEQRQGRLDESKKYFALARKLDPRCPLLDKQI